MMFHKLLNEQQYAINHESKQCEPLPAAISHQRSATSSNMQPITSPLISGTWLKAREKAKQHESHCAAVN